MNVRPISTAAKVVAHGIDNFGVFGRNTNHFYNPLPTSAIANNTLNTIKKGRSIFYSDMTRMGVGAAIGSATGAMSAGLTDRSLFAGAMGGAVMGGAFGYASNRHLISATSKSLMLSNISSKNARFATRMGYNGGAGAMGLVAGGFLASKRQPSNSFNNTRGYRL